MMKKVGAGVLLTTFVFATIAMASWYSEDGSEAKSGQSTMQPDDETDVRARNALEERNRAVASKAKRGIEALEHVYNENQKRRKTAEDETNEYLEIVPLFFEDILAREKPEEESAQEMARDGKEYLMETGNVASELSDVRCSKTLCRLEIVHEDETAFEKFNRSRENIDGPFRGTQLGVYDENEEGRMTTTIYYFGIGERLPMDRYEEYKRGST
jgi:hypothetical protein